MFHNKANRKHGRFVELFDKNVAIYDFFMAIKLKPAVTFAAMYYKSHYFNCLAHPEVIKPPKENIHEPEDWHDEPESPTFNNMQLALAAQPEAPVVKPSIYRTLIYLDGMGMPRLCDDFDTGAPKMTFSDWLQSLLFHTIHEFLCGPTDKMNTKDCPAKLLWDDVSCTATFLEAGYKDNTKDAVKNLERVLDVLQSVTSPETLSAKTLAASLKIIDNAHEMDKVNQALHFESRGIYIMKCAKALLIRDSQDEVAASKLKRALALLSASAACDDFPSIDCVAVESADGEEGGGARPNVRNMQTVLSMTCIEIMSESVDHANEAFTLFSKLRMEEATPNIISWMKALFGHIDFVDTVLSLYLMGIISALHIGKTSRDMSQTIDPIFTENSLDEAHVISLLDVVQLTMKQLPIAVRAQCPISEWEVIFIIIIR